MNDEKAMLDIIDSVRKLGACVATLTTGLQIIHQRLNTLEITAETLKAKLFSEVNNVNA